MDHGLHSRPPRRALAAAVAGVAFALVLAACGPAAPALTDPAEILQQGAASLGTLKTVHLRGTIDGEVPLTTGGAGGGVPLKLTGTTIDGDVDVAGQALAVELLAPSLLNLRVNLVVVDGITYLKAPMITRQRWFRQPAATGVGGDPAGILAGLATFLGRPELKPALLPDTRCTGTDCYVVRFMVPAAEVRNALGSVGTAIPGLAEDAVGDVTVTVGIRKGDLRLGTLGLDIPAGGAATLAIRLELSRYDEPVTIAAPPADEVDDAPGG